MLRKSFFLSLSVIFCAIIFASCKTSEANYRAAYEKAIAGRDSLTALENTVYGRHRRNTTSSLAIAGNDTVEMIATRVRVTEGGGGINENLKPYSVVVGQFKQLVNAKSLRERLVDAGYPSAFVVETAEPYYYIILNSYPNRAMAVEECVKLSGNKDDFPIRISDGLPVVLYCPR